MRRRQYLPVLVLTVVVVASVATTSPVSDSTRDVNALPSTVLFDGRDTARSAADFTSSVGVGVHWTYADTPYGDRYPEVRSLLLDLGVRHVRGDVSRAADLAGHGVKSLVLVDSDIAGRGDPVSQVQQVTPLALVDAVDGVEGPNEADVFWVQGNRSYKGQRFPGGVVAWQKDLYAAVKADPSTRSVTVVGPSLGETYWNRQPPWAPGSLTSVVDLGNFHPYPTGNPFTPPTPYAGIGRYYWESDFPSGTLDLHPINLETYAPAFGGKPMTATETGYSTYRFGQSESVQAKYMPRLFLENFRLGIKRTYAYELVDSFDDPSGLRRDAHFGLLRHDLTLKPAYNAVQSLLQVTSNTGAAPSVGTLSYRLTVVPPKGYQAQYLHRVLLQKTDNSFVLALWHEVSADDLSGLDRTPQQPIREVAQPPLAVSLALWDGMQGVRVQHLDQNGKLRASAALMHVDDLSLSVSDSLTFVSIPASHG